MICHAILNRNCMHLSASFKPLKAQIISSCNILAYMLNIQAHHALNHHRPQPDDLSMSLFDVPRWPRLLRRFQEFHAAHPEQKRSISVPVTTIMGCCWRQQWYSICRHDNWLVELVSCPKIGRAHLGASFSVIGSSFLLNWHFFFSLFNWIEA